MFQEIKMTMDELVKAESQSSPIGSGIYKATIQAAYIRDARETQAKALVLNLKLIENMTTKEKIEAQREIPIWFIGRYGDNNEFGARKIFSLQAMLGLPMLLSPSIFTEGLYKTRAFNPDSGTYEEMDKQGYLYKDIVGKTCYVLIGVEYELYNADVKKRYDIVTFFNQQLKTSTEIKQGKEAGAYKVRLEKALQREKESYAKYGEYIPDENPPITEIKSATKKQDKIAKTDDAIDKAIENTEEDDYIPF